MKRLSTIIMALALVLGMSQCKKQETSTTTGNNTEGTVHITVKVDGKDGKDENGDKHAIAPEHGLFAFTNNDIIYVGHGGKYVGQLEFTNGFFEGDITPVTGANDNLHFYFLGGMTPATAPTVGTTESFTISIANQSQNLPVLSYGASTTQFTNLNTTYSVTLKNKCALVKLSLSTPTTETVTLSGVPTVATVNFANPSLETAIAATDLEDLNDITLRYDANWNENLRWVILLPGTNLEDKIGEDEGDLAWTGEGSLVIGNNTYINANLTLNNTAAVTGPDPEYAVKNSDGELTQFSVSANKKVYFSRGNLKASFSTNSFADGWSFHNTQFDEIDGPFNVVMGQTQFTHQQSNSNSNNPVNENGLVFSQGKSSGDRFTWGYFDEIKLTTSDYLDVNENLTKTAAVAKDWGCVFTESSPEGGNWRTLSADEWIYLFNGATTGTSATVRGTKRFLRVFLKNYRVPDGEEAGEPYYGVFVFPDLYTGEGLSGSYSFNSVTGNPAVIEYSSADVQKMLNAGAVFLPCVGYRYKERYYDYLCYDYNSYIGAGIGYYWSSSCTNNNEFKAKALHIVVRAGASYGTYTTPQVLIENLERQYGYCVRLVWDAN